jgi:hypothetical protein
MLRPSAWMTIAFGVYLLPDEGGLVLIERDGIEIVERSVQNLIAAVEVEAEWGGSYLSWKEQAAL